ncbi:MAG: hypothetical protein R3D53_08840 [Paracoccaceae bacterium]
MALAQGAPGQGAVPSDMVADLLDRATHAGIAKLTNGLSLRR